MTDITVIKETIKGIFGCDDFDHLVVLEGEYVPLTCFMDVLETKNIKYNHLLAVDDTSVYHLQRIDYASLRWAYVKEDHSRSIRGTILRNYVKIIRANLLDFDGVLKLQ